MKKRSLVWILVAALLLGCILPAGPAAAAGNETVNRLLDDLIRMLYREEILYGDQLIVLDAFERFDLERSWESLQLARASLSLAQQDVASLTPEEPTLTAEDELALLDEGTDVSFMENSGDSFRAEQTGFLNTCSTLQANILLDMFLQDDWEIAMKHVRVLREIADCYLRYYANLADWILLRLDNPRITEMFNELLAEYCPLIHARRAVSPVSEAENEAATDALLKKEDDLYLELRKITGAKDARVTLLEEQIAAGSWEQIGKNLLPVSGLPALIFYPSRFSTAEIRYYWTENDEILPTPSPASMPDRIPDYCRVRIEGYPLEEAKEYKQALADAGLSPLRTAEEDETLSLLYAYDGSSVSVEWSDETLTITMLENPLLFVPQWYLPARNAADGN